MSYYVSTEVSLPFDDALARVKEAFAAEGFGTLTEIDVQAVMKEKLDKEMGAYVIVGACNPTLASRALEAEPLIGVLMPCNVVVRETDAGVVVDAMDPGLMARLVERDEIVPVAEEARRLVSSALERLSASM